MMQLLAFGVAQPKAGDTLIYSERGRRKMGKNL